MGKRKRLHMAERTAFALRELRYPPRMIQTIDPTTGLPLLREKEGSEVGRGVRLAAMRLADEADAQRARLGRAMAAQVGAFGENFSRQQARQAKRRGAKMPLDMTAARWHELNGFAKVKARRRR